MMAAAGIARRLGMIDQELVDRQRNVLKQYNLPVAVSGMTTDEIIAATKTDKKSRGGSIRWVLLEGHGRATTRRNIPEELVRKAIEEVISGE